MFFFVFVFYPCLPSWLFSGFWILAFWFIILFANVPLLRIRVIFVKMLKENKGGGVNLKSSCCLSKNHSSCFCFPCAFVLASLLPPSLSYNSFDLLMCAPVLCSTFNYFSYLYHVDSIPLFDSCQVHLWLLFLVPCSYSSVFCLVIGLFS